METGARDGEADVLQEMIDLAADAGLTCDERGIVTSCNPAFESLFRYGAGEAVGLSIERLLVGLALGDTDEGRRAKLDDARGSEAYAQGRRKDGSSFAARVRMRRVVWSGKSVIVAVVWSADSADERLRESQEMLKAVMDGTTAVIFIKDVEGRYLLSNRRFEDLFHVQNDWLRGKTDFDFLPAEVATAVRANDREVVRRRAPIEFDETVPSDGDAREYISIKFPLMRPTGEIYAICGIATDITERKRAEQRLRQTYAQLQDVVVSRASSVVAADARSHEEFAQREWLFREVSNLIAAAHEGIWALNVEGRTRFVNRRMADMLGCGVDEVLGRSFSEFVPEEWRSEAGRYLTRQLQGIEEQQDCELRRKDGSALWTLASTSPIRDREGRVVGTLGMFTDITARKHAEEQQKRLLRELDHRVKNTMAMVNALAELTMRSVGSLAEFREAFGARIQSLARTHEALAQARWGDVELAELLALVLAAPMGVCPGRILISGAPVSIPACMVTALALTVSELGANALKHGALSSSEGEIRINWSCDDDGRLSLVWAERHSFSGLTVREGTGSQLMHGLVEYELGGELRMEHGSRGLLCTIRVPLQSRKEVSDRSQSCESKDVEARVP